jgi:hypothetical protein
MKNVQSVRFKQVSVISWCCWWELFIKVVVPVEVVILVGWWIYQSALVDNWYNPISEFSLLTIVVQWGIALGLFAFYNRKIANKTEDPQHRKQSTQ